MFEFYMFKDRVTDYTFIQSKKTKSNNNFKKIKKNNDHNLFKFPRNVWNYLIYLKKNENYIKYNCFYITIYQSLLAE